MAKKKPRCLVCDQFPRVEGRPMCRRCQLHCERAPSLGGSLDDRMIEWAAQRTRRYASADGRKKRKALENLTQANMQFIAYVDSVMKPKAGLTPRESFERAQLVAKALSALEMLNDSVRYGDLGIDFRSDHRELRAVVTQEQMTEVMRILGLLDAQ